MVEQSFREESMLARLLKKISFVRKVEGGKENSAAEKEVWRQIQEIKDDPITGKSITKSGEED